MLDQVLRIFSLRVHHDLDIMRKGQSLEDVTSRVLTGMKTVLAAERPDMVIVQGDTTTAFAASLASYYAQIPVGHVEAGLRTWSKYSPFPEEINRVLATHIADLHFPPTSQSRINLLREGIDPARIVITGNTVIDALYYTRASLRASYPRFERQFPSVDFSRRLILVTGHRRENFGTGFQAICHAIRSIAETEQDVEIIYPVHLNPNVQRPVRKILEGLRNVHLIAPLEYRPFVFPHGSLIPDSDGLRGGTGRSSFPGKARAGHAQAY